MLPPPPPQRLLNILKFITCIIIVIVPISLPISCKKIDFSTDKVLAIERNKFFSLPAGAPPVLERIVNDMKRQDAIKPFVHNFIKNVGYPAWQHVKINISRPAYQSAEPESDTLVTVPIVKEDVGYLSGVLAIKVNSEVWYKLLEGIKYYELPIEESGTSTEEIFTVLDFFKMMMSLEYEMFGQNEFVITDEELLNRLSAQIYLSGEPEISYDYGTQLSFSNGCTIFNYGYYTSSEFIITSTEALCLYEPAGLVYMLTVPETGGGGSTGGTGSGTPGTTNTDDEECKRGFVGVTEFDEQGEPILPCTPNHNNTFDSTLLTKISQSCCMQLDSLYNWGMSNNFREQSFIVVKKGDSIYPKNFLPGSLSGDMTRVNYHLDVGETLLAFAHTHAEDTVRYYRTSFSPDDLIEFNKNANRVGYTALLEVGNARYAFVLENLEKKSAFNFYRKGRHVKLYIALFSSLVNQISNGQMLSEQTMLQYLGSATVSGIGFYKSTAPDKNNFIKLNP